MHVLNVGLVIIFALAICTEKEAMQQFVLILNFSPSKMLFMLIPQS